MTKAMFRACWVVVLLRGGSRFPVLGSLAGCNLADDAFIVDLRVGGGYSGHFHVLCYYVTSNCSMS